MCVQRAEALKRPSPAAVSTSSCRTHRDRAPTKPVSTQESFGRILAALHRDKALAPYLVTTAPDVASRRTSPASSTGAGVFAPEKIRSWNDDPVLKWVEGPSGQHIELGISEMNLFLLLGQLGLAWDISDQPLLPIGTVYDPFVCRGLDAFIYSMYSGSRFVIAGTPSGVTLAPEGGAHQSTITASIGLELPGVTLIEPAYSGALDLLLCDALGAHRPRRRRRDRRTSGSRRGRSTRRRSRPLARASATGPCARRCSRAATASSTPPPWRRRARPSCTWPPRVR